MKLFRKKKGKGLLRMKLYVQACIKIIESEVGHSAGVIRRCRIVQWHQVVIFSYTGEFNFIPLHTISVSPQ